MIKDQWLIQIVIKHRDFPINLFYDTKKQQETHMKSIIDAYCKVGDTLHLTDANCLIPKKEIQYIKAHNNRWKVILIDRRKEEKT